jgi:Iap family predicted aminopeptidase
MAQKVDEVPNSVLCVCVRAQEPGIYNECHLDYPRQAITDLAWERISPKMESAMYIHIF